MMITSSQVRRANDHEATYITVGWNIADFGETSWTKEAIAFDFRMANTEAWGRGIRKSSRESH